MPEVTQQFWRFSRFYLFRFAGDTGATVSGTAPHSRFAPRVPGKEPGDQVRMNHAFLTTKGEWLAERQDGSQEVFTPDTPPLEYQTVGSYTITAQADDSEHICIWPRDKQRAWDVTRHTFTESFEVTAAPSIRGILVLSGEIQVDDRVRGPLEMVAFAPDEGEVLTTSEETRIVLLESGGPYDPDA